MADKEKKNPLQLPEEDQEYRPQEEEEYVVDPEKKSRKSILKSLLTNKRVWLAVGVVVAVGVVYQVVKVPTVKEEIEAAAEKPLQSRPQAQTQPQTLAGMTSSPATGIENTAVQPQTNVVGPVADTTTEQQQIQQLVTQNAQNQVQIQQLQTALQQMQATTLQASNKAALCTANNSLRQLAPVSILMEKPRSKTTSTTGDGKKYRKKQVPRLIYYVRAVVPGRAWLHATNGKLITVKVGDYLPGYGRVQMINPKQGKVWTSWKSVITYGSNDS